MKWTFSYSLFATITVTLLVGWGTNWLLHCFFRFSRTQRKERKKLSSPEKSSPACTSVAAAVAPLHVIQMLGFYFCFCATVMFFPCVTENSRGKMDLLSLLKRKAASQVSSLWRRPDSVTHYKFSPWIYSVWGVEVLIWREMIINMFRCVQSCRDGAGKVYFSCFMSVPSWDNRSKVKSNFSQMYSSFYLAIKKPF